MKSQLLTLMTWHHFKASITLYTLNFHNTYENEKKVKFYGCFWLKPITFRCGIQSYKRNFLVLKEKTKLVLYSLTIRYVNLD